MLRIDLHVHSTHSGDSLIPVGTLLTTIKHFLPLDGVAITDHDSTYVAKLARNLTKRYGVLLIPGVEVSTNEGHLLVLGVEEVPKPPISAFELADLAREAGGVVIAAHPCDRRREGIGDLLGELKVDCIEVINARSPKRANEMARMLARSLGLPGVGGSDAHTLVEVGRAFTLINSEPDIDEILNALKKGKVSARRGRVFRGAGWLF